MAAAPELEPIAAFTLKRAIKPLALLCGFVVAWGVCKVVDRFVRALFSTVDSTVGWIPFLGRVVTVPIHRVEQKVTDALGGWAHGLEADIGDALHQLGAMVRQVGEAIRNADLILYDVVKLLGTFLSYKSWIAFYKTLVGHDYAIGKRITKTQTSAHATAKTATHAAKVATHAQARTIALPGELNREWAIPGLRERVGELERGAPDVWKWVRSHGKSLATGAFVGVVAFALGKLGAGWVRCSNVKQLGRRACGMDHSLLESLLADTLLITSAISIVELAKELQGVMPEITDVIRFGIREAHAADVEIKQIASGGP